MGLLEWKDIKKMEVGKTYQVKNVDDGIDEEMVLDNMKHDNGQHDEGYIAPTYYELSFTKVTPKEGEASDYSVMKTYNSANDETDTQIFDNSNTSEYVLKGGRKSRRRKGGRKTKKSRKSRKSRKSKKSKKSRRGRK